MILVTAATGNVGRPLIARLLAAGLPVRAITRTPQTANLPAGVDVVAGDPSHPGTLASAMRGVTGLFLNPIAVQSATTELLTLARSSGVQRVVALSAINVDDDPADQPSRIRGANHRAVEDALHAGQIPWVALRPTAFASNSIGMWAAQIRAQDVVRGPYAQASAAPIDARDVADVAAHAFLTDALLGTTPVLTGPRSLTQQEMVGAIGEAVDRPLRYQELPPEVAKRAMIDRGFPLPEAFIDRMFSMLAKTVGQPAVTTDEVQKLLGRPARSYLQWARDHAAAFARP